MAVDIALDPTVAIDGGDGSIGSPYTRADGQVEQWVFDNVASSGTGNYLHIKSGIRVAPIAGPLNLGTFGNPSFSNPLRISGYDLAFGDGGVADIDMGGNSLWQLTTYQSVNFINCHLHNFGNNQPINTGSNCGFYNCEIADSTYASGYAIDIANGQGLFGCYIHDLGGSTGTILLAGARVENCYIVHAPTVGRGVALNNVNGSIVRNNVHICTGAATQAIRAVQVNVQIVGNSCYSVSGVTSTTSAIHNNTSGAYCCQIINNVISGFATAIELFGGERSAVLFDNDWHDCPNGIANRNRALIDVRNNDVGEQPFVDPAGGDFTVIESLRGEGWPDYVGGDRIQTSPTFVDPGAVQSTSTGGGGDVPEEKDVRFPVVYDGGNKTGTCQVPVDTDVRFGTAVDVADTGRVIVPVGADVRLLVATDVADVGTIAVPRAGRVIEGEPVDTTVGTYTQITAPDVREGEQWGEDGTEYTGTLVVSGTAGGLIRADWQAGYTG